MSDLSVGGEQEYQEWRQELLSTPELQRIYDEEAAKKERWLQRAEAQQAAELTLTELADTTDQS